MSKTKKEIEKERVELEGRIVKLEEKLQRHKQEDERKNGGTYSDDGQLKELWERIRFGEENITQEIGSNLEQVIILGSTGAGKTTAANIFTRKSARVEKQDMKVIYNYGSSHLASDTTLPRKYVDYDNEILFWDTPGFFDSNGFARDISNYFYIKKILNLTGKLKFISLLNKNDISTRAAHIDLDKITQLQGFLDKVNNLAAHTILVINRVEDGTTVEDAIQALRKTIDYFETHGDKHSKKLSDPEKIEAKRFLTYYLTHPDQVVLLKKADASQKGKLVDLSVEVQRLDNAIGSIKPLAMSGINIDTNFLTTPEYFAKIATIYKNKFVVLYGQVDELFKKSLDAFDKFLPNSSNLSHNNSSLPSYEAIWIVSYKDLRAFIPACVLNANKIKELLEKTKIFYQNEASYKKLLTLIENIFEFASFCEDLFNMQRDNLVQIKQEYIDSMKDAAVRFVKNAQNLLKQKILDSFKGLSQELNILMTNEFSENEQLLNDVMSEDDLRNKLSEHTEAERECLRKLETKIYISEIRERPLYVVKQLQETSAPVTSYSVIILFYSRLVDDRSVVTDIELMRSGNVMLRADEDIMTVVNQIKSLYDNFKADTISKIETQKSQIITMVPYYTKDKLDLFFKKVYEEFIGKTLNQGQEFIRFIPDNLKNLSFKEIINHIKERYEGSIDARNIIRELCIMEADLSSRYDFTQEQEICISSFLCNFFSPAVSNFVFFVPNMQAWGFDHSDIRLLHVPISAAQLQNVQALFVNERGHLAQQEKCLKEKGTELNQREAALEEKGTELNQREAALALANRDTNCCNISYLHGAKYDNKLLEHYDFIIQILSHFGTKGLDQLLELTNGLDAESTSDLTQLSLCDIQEYFNIQPLGDLFQTQNHLFQSTDSFEF